MSSPRDFPSLDGLRTLAISSVLIGHLIPIDSLQRVVGWGDTGVILFFCLSGFLITNILLTARDSFPNRRGPNLLAFYGRRFLRIFPIYYATLGIALLVGCAAVSANLARLATYSLNIPGLPPTGPLGPAAHLWSLSVEEQFYCFWPFVMFFVPRRWLLTVCLGMVILCFISKLLLCASGAGYGTIFRPLTGCMDSLGLGAVAAILRHDFPSFGSRLSRPFFLVCLAVLSLVAYFRLILPIDPWFNGYLLFGLCQFFVSALAFTGILVYVTENPASYAARFLGLPPMRFVARISYGLYLYHFFMPWIPRWLTIQWLDAGHKVNMTHTMYSSIFVCISLSLSFLVAFASWRYIEEPLLRLKNHFDYA